jgi:hypothetical protein
VPKSNVAPRQLACLAVTDDQAIKFVVLHLKCAVAASHLTSLVRLMCARLRLLPPPPKSAFSKSAVSSPPSPNRGGHASTSPKLHDPKLSPETLALLPEPSLLVEILSEVAMHEDVRRESIRSIMTLMGVLLQRYISHNAAP